MTNKQYSIALTVTYVPYIVAELPSNLLLKVRIFYLKVYTANKTDTEFRKAVGPNLMLPTMLTLWGIVTTLQGT